MTARDLQVLQRVANGCTAKEIAGELGMSQRTVEYHVERAKREMGARSMAEAVYKLARRKSAKIPTRQPSELAQLLWHEEER